MAKPKCLCIVNVTPKRAIKEGIILAVKDCPVHRMDAAPAER